MWVRTEGTGELAIRAEISCVVPLENPTRSSLMIRIGDQSWYDILKTLPCHLKMRRQLFNAQTSEGIQKYLIQIYQVEDQWLGCGLSIRLHYSLTASELDEKTYYSLTAFSLSQHRLKHRSFVRLHYLLQHPFLVLKSDWSSYRLMLIQAMYFIE